MRKLWPVVLLIFALLVGGGVFAYASRSFDRLVATRPLVVAAVPLPPYTIVTEDMLIVRELPRVLEAEPIYLEPAEVVGRITTGPIPAGALLYRAQVVAPAQFRLAPAELEVVSIPVDPARAVGGQIEIGHVVNIYRVALERNTLGENSLPELLEGKGAAAELLVTAPVVDVRDSRGLPTNEQQAASQIEREGQVTAENRPLQIVTLAVPPELVQPVVELAVEQSSSEYELWLSLASVGTPVTQAPAAAAEDDGVTVTGASKETVEMTPAAVAIEETVEMTPVAPAIEETVAMTPVAATSEETVEVTPNVTVTATPAPTPALQATRIVTGTGGSALRLRATPGDAAPVLTILNVGTIVTPTGVLSNTWQQVQVPGFTGWVASAYLSVP